MVQQFMETRERRERRVDISGSPNFPHSFGIIPATTGREHLDMRVTFPGSRRYEPLTTVRISNQADEDVDIFINGVNFALLPAGVITTISDEAMWTFELRNTQGTATAAGEIRANFSRPPLGADEAARRAIR